MSVLLYVGTYRMVEWNDGENYKLQKGRNKNIEGMLVNPTIICSIS